MRHLFIINPAAGGRDKTDYVASEVAKAFSGREEEYEIYITTGPMDACRKIEEAAQTGEELRVYACGGDGTLNECVCGAAERDNVSITHFPCGTGNDFIRMFGDEKSRFISLPELIDGQVRKIDVIRCNDRYSVNICSVGIDARIGTNVHKYSSIPLIGGATGYVISTVVQFAKGIAEKMTVSAGGRTFDEEISLVCVCNGTYYGGGFNPVPTARPDDGLLDILVVPKVSRLTFAMLVGSYAKGNFRKHPNRITHIQDKKAVIDAPKEFVVNLDGEAVFTDHLEMEVKPGALNFVFPANMEFFDNKQEKIEAK